MIKTDQPGRYLAVFFFAPILLYKAVQYKDKFIGIFAIMLFCWDLFWILNEQLNLQNPIMTLAQKLGHHTPQLENKVYMQS